uniref:Uncharacterized protein n=1 Tax=Magnetococcus massalia (strain MO-1) TaxID=451514 RepID=A0A1S7LGZ1_MAGMO|nr:protein of unknown function [Candidatus Magnetococcus massalia]
MVWEVGGGNPASYPIPVAARFQFRLVLSPAMKHFFVRWLEKVLGNICSISKCRYNIRV